MEIKKTGVAGTVESSDIIVRIEPGEEPGVKVHLTSSVMQQFGRIIEQTIRETLDELDVDNVRVEAVDKGALDCTVRARTAAAAYRAAECTDYEWRVQE